MAQTRIHIRIEEEVRDAADAVARELGISLSSVITLTLRQMVRDQALPFLPTVMSVHDESLRDAAKRGSEQILDADNYVGGYDHTLWMDVDRIKHMDEDEMFDPVLGRQDILFARKQWKERGVEPAQTLRDNGYETVTLFRIPDAKPWERA